MIVMKLYANINYCEKLRCSKMWIPVMKKIINSVWNDPEILPKTFFKSHHTTCSTWKLLPVCIQSRQ